MSMILEVYETGSGTSTPPIDIPVRFAPQDPKTSSRASESVDDDSPQLSSPRILIVEDEIFVALHIESILLNLDYAVAGNARTGEEAIQQALAEPTDLILMDVNLGAGIDGIEAARRIRSQRNIPIVFVTAYTGEAAVAKIKAALPDAVIVGKPISPEQLQAVIISILGS